MNLDRNTVVTPITLLDAFEQYMRGRAGEPRWEESEVQAEPASLCRLRQLKAMCQAFGIDGGPRDFAKGLFLEGREQEYERLVESMRPLMRPTFAERARGDQVRVVFRMLRRYRQEMRRAQHSYGTFLCYSGFIAHVAEDVIEPINDEMRRLLEPIDSLLAAIISPDGQTFTVGQLIDEFGYVDQSASEIEWRETWGCLYDDDDGDEAGSSGELRQ
jgi:hypothetical protein